MKSLLLRKLAKRRIWQRIFRERLTEPLHLNLFSAFVWAFGSYRAKIDYDLVLRQNNAFGLLKAAEIAHAHKIKTVSVIEFGVASGAGLFNMAYIAEKVSRSMGVAFKVYGFDTGTGMPPARDYRDHPELYQEGDFRMNEEALRRSLPANTRLIIGDVAESAGHFIEKLSPEEPLGYIVFDVDYYSSMKGAMKVLTAADPTRYLPIVNVFLDDITIDYHNSYCGELLAVREFNAENKMRKLEHPRFLENQRIFKNASWIKQMYFFHVLDHPVRQNIVVSGNRRDMLNPYLDFKGNREQFTV